jgi:hypothetical protein
LPSLRRSWVVSDATAPKIRQLSFLKCNRLLFSLRELPSAATSQALQGRQRRSDATFPKGSQMSTILIIILLVVVLGGGGGYYAHGAYGGAGLGGVLGLVLVVLLVLWLVGRV